MSDNGELVAVEESTVPTLHNQFDMVDVDAAAAFMDNYQELVKALLDDEEDYQGNKKKKSAWMISFSTTQSLMLNAVANFLQIGRAHV